MSSPPRPSNGIPFRVDLPANIQTGQTVRITCPDGTTSTRKLPSNVQAGDSMLLELSLHQLKNPKEVLSLLQPDESNHPTTKAGGFLDRDIVNVQDVFIALTVGMIIGVGVVFGFVVGILYSTQRVTNTTRHGMPQARLRLETAATGSSSRIPAPGVGMTKKKASSGGATTQSWTSATMDRS
eukprot:Nitzschia sp. Nitz4//scaffold15_size197535//30330//30875//NITZ4_001557-RA/size197535-processed-gene-0.56-mRNA-1//-1//CDS//3329537652//3114//frame0